MLVCGRSSQLELSSARCASIARTKTAPDQTAKHTSQRALRAPPAGSRGVLRGFLSFFFFSARSNRGGVARRAPRAALAESPQVPGDEPGCVHGDGRVHQRAPLPEQAPQLAAAPRAVAQVRAHQELHAQRRLGQERAELGRPARPRRPLPLPRQTRLYDGHRRRSGFRTRRRPRDEKARPRRSLRRSLRLRGAPALGGALRRRPGQPRRVLPGAAGAQWPGMPAPRDLAVRQRGVPGSLPRTPRRLGCMALRGSPRRRARDRPRGCAHCLPLPAGAVERV